MFDRYLQLLLKWNRTYNLTSITDPREIQVKHFEDSLSPLPCLPPSSRLLDIGSGAGFPGIPLKIKRPDLEVFLLESRQKKAVFCEMVIRELKLKNIFVVQKRAEDIIKTGELGFFDIVISRATFSLEKFLNLALPFAKKTGLAIAMKGPRWKEEFKDFIRWEFIQTISYELKDSYGERSLLLFKLR